MPAALTLDQKKERAEQALVSKEPVADVTPSGVRRKRGTFNGTTGKLHVNADKLIAQGYHVHIVNDDEGRIPALLDRGYEHVLSHEIDGITSNAVSRNIDIGDKVCFLVGTKKTGEPLTAYLMKIKKEWYEEDMQEIQDRNDKIDDSIRRGKNGLTDSRNFYSRDGEIKMKT